MRPSERVLIAAGALLALAAPELARAETDPLRDPALRRVREAFPVERLSLFDKPAPRAVRGTTCSDSANAGLVWCASGTAYETSENGTYTRTFGYNLDAAGRVVYVILTRREFPLARSAFDDTLKALGARYGSAPATLKFEGKTADGDDFVSLVAYWGNIKLVRLTEAELRLVAQSGALGRGPLVDHRQNLRLSAQRREPVYRVDGTAGFIAEFRSVSDVRTDYVQRVVYQPAFLGEQPAKPEAAAAPKFRDYPLDPGLARALAAVKAEEERLAAIERAKREAEERKIAAERARQEEEERRIADARRAEEERVAAIERARREEEERKAAEARRIAEEAERKRAAERAAAEERARREEAERRAAEEKRLAEERARREEAERKAAEAKRIAEQRARMEEAERKAAAERRALEERARRAEAEYKATLERVRRAELERKAAEERARQAEAERLAAEERTRRIEEERKAAEARREAERRAEEKQAEERRLADERRFAEERARREEAERRAAEERRSAEEKIAALDRASRAEAERRAAEAKRRAAEARRSAEEERAAEERRKAEERRAAEERRVAEERRSAVERPSAETPAPAPAPPPRAEAEPPRPPAEQKLASVTPGVGGPAPNQQEWLRMAIAQSRNSNANWVFERARDPISEDIVMRTRAVFSEPGAPVALEIAFECNLGAGKRLTAYVRAFDENSKASVAIPSEDGRTSAVRGTVTLDEDAPQTAFLFPERGERQASIVEIPLQHDDLRKNTPRAEAWLRHYRVTLKFRAAKGETAATVYPYAENLRRVLEACAN